MLRFSFWVLALFVISLPAVAHPGHSGAPGGFGAGFSHPLLGLDHVLAMVAVGLWAAVLGGKAIWKLPAAFVVCMVCGFALALAGMRLPAAEPGIAASVAVLGILVAAAIRLPLASAMCLVGVFALFHGHAHGAELTGAAPAFGLGLVVATSLLHGAGLGIGRLLARRRRFLLARGLGAAVAATGVLLLGGWA